MKRSNPAKHRFRSRRLREESRRGQSETLRCTQ